MAEAVNIQFLSTPSARRATRLTANLKSDYLFLSTPSARRATKSGNSFLSLSVFLSTPSARRATRTHTVFQPDRVISIHALREEGDAPLSVR